MAAVEGFDPAKSNQTHSDASGNPVPVGVWGDSSTGVGVFGTSGLLPPATPDIPTDLAGVEGHSLENTGVRGRSVADFGVTGESTQSGGVLARSGAGAGLLGVTFGAAPDGKGVFGVSTTTGDGVVGFVGGATGVVGNSVRGDGVYGISGSGDGVVGENYSQPDDPLDPLPSGVVGRSTLGNGVSGSSTSASGVFGLNDAAGAGVWGSNCSSTAGVGVKGTSVVGTGVAGSSLAGGAVTGDSLLGTAVAGFSSRGTGVLGESGSADGFAGVFLGRVRVTGPLLKGGGGFQIDHPLDPANKYLSHSFVESPEMLNVYAGRVTTDGDGRAVVELPDYFDALNSDCCYQLTVIGGFARAAVLTEVDENRFTVGTDEPGVTVCWQVTAVRRDRWAARHRIPVEADKPAAERGRYLHPDVWGGDGPASTDVTRLGPAVADQLAQARALLPEDVDERVEHRLRSVLAGADVDHAELHRLVAEGLRSARVPRRPRRTSREQLERDWQAVAESVGEPPHTASPGEPT